MSLDADHKHLYELVKILPGPNDFKFWKNVADINDTSVEYVYEKMATSANYIDSPTPENVSTNINYFCEYVIMFFGGSKTRLWALLTSTVFSTSPEDSQVGRFLAEDLTATAWRLIARYGHAGHSARAWSGAYPPPYDDE
jgi:hypothetical protein